MAAQQQAPGDWLAPLDGLRGVSILMVMTAHISAPGWEALGGNRGVTVFFVLSGFLITRLLIKEQRKTGGVDLRAFYIRRSFRLFPIYYLVLLAYCVLLLGLRLRPELAHGFKQALPWYLVYLQEVPRFGGAGGDPHPFYQAWSLGIEEKFYLVWPVLAFVVLKSARARAWAASIGIVCCALAPELGHFGDYLAPYSPIFLGCLLALAGLDATGPRWLAGPVAAFGTVLLLALLQGVAAASWGTVSWLADALYPVSVAALLLASLACPALGRVLSFGPLTLLGRLSYGIYLIHLLVRNGVDMALRRLGVVDHGGLVTYTAMLLGSTLGAWLMYRTVEAPLRDFGRRLAARGVISR